MMMDGLIFYDKMVHQMKHRATRIGLPFLGDQGEFRGVPGNVRNSRRSSCVQDSSSITSDECFVLSFFTCSICNSL